MTAPRHYARWQPHELEILRREYPAGGYKHVGRLLPHRSLDTIRMRASALGIRARSRRGCSPSVGATLDQEAA